MLPIIELRGAIPFATAIGVPPLTAYVISIIGNMVPVPLIFLFASKFLHWGKDKAYIGKMCHFFLEKGVFLRYHRGVKNLTQRRVKNVNYY